MDTSAKKALRSEGYIVIRDAVPAELVRSARRAANASLGAGALVFDGDERPLERSITPQLTRSSVLSDLVLRSRLGNDLEELLGPSSIHLPLEARVLGTFPLESTEQYDERDEVAPGIDGLVNPNPYYPNGAIENYTLSLTVDLSVAHSDFHDSVIVWPGTHRQYAEYLSEYGPLALASGLPEVNLPEPRTLRLRSGDAVLMHFLTGRHDVSNSEPWIGIKATFRIHCKNHNSPFWNEFLHLYPLVDLWSEWPGLQGLDDGTVEF